MGKKKDMRDNSGLVEELCETIIGLLKDYEIRSNTVFLSVLATVMENQNMLNLEQLLFGLGTRYPEEFLDSLGRILTHFLSDEGDEDIKEKFSKFVGVLNEKDVEALKMLVDRKDFGGRGITIRTGSGDDSDIDIEMTD